MEFIGSSTLEATDFSDIDTESHGIDYNLNNISLTDHHLGSIDLTDHDDLQCHVTDTFVRKGELGIELWEEEEEIQCDKCDDRFDSYVKAILPLPQILEK